MHQQLKLSPTSDQATAVSECLDLQLALLRLQAIDDRDGWQCDLMAHLLAQEAPEGAADPFADSRLESLINVLDLYVRLFEVRLDLSFRHEPHRFDANGFLPLVADSYTRRWWNSVSESDLCLAENFLGKYGLLEFREKPDANAGCAIHSVMNMRLRADRIVAMLRDFDPIKYSELPYLAAHKHQQ